MSSNKSLSQFTFEPSGYGAYNVTYETKRGDYYVARITDMTIIDATKNKDAYERKLSDIATLRDICKRGTHYNKRGQEMAERTDCLQGGARGNSGRKRKEEKRQTFTFRLSPEAIAKVKELRNNGRNVGQIIENFIMLL